MILEQVDIHMFKNKISLNSCLILYMKNVLRLIIATNIKPRTQYFLK